jgi:hypothetical protein
MTLFIVVAVWAANYAQVFTTSVNDAAGYTQAVAITTSAATAVNTACAYGTNDTFLLPCAFEGGQMVPVELTLGSPAGSITASLPGSNVSASRSILCTTAPSDQIVYICDSTQGEWACVANQANGINLTDGSCNGINTTVGA